MRLLITTDTVGGVWTFSCDLTQQLLARGWEVMLVTVGTPPTPAQAKTHDRLAADGSGALTLRHLDVPLEWMEDGGSCYEHSAELLFEVCEAFAPDLLHLNQFCYGALPVTAPKVVGAHSDVLSWWRARYGAAMPASSWKQRYSELLEAGLAGAATVVAPTHAYLRELGRDFRLPRTRVIANGRTTRSAALADDEVWTGKQLQAVSCGRVWDEGKNVRLLEQAGSSLPIRIAGACARDGATNPWEGHKVAGVEYLGALPENEVENLLLESALYVVTSRYEPFGLAPVEAARAGCPVIANHLETLREVWGDAAIFFARDDAKALCTTLDELRHDPARVRAAAAACRERALRCFSAHRMADDYEQLYGELLAGKRGVHAG